MRVVIPLEITVTLGTPYLADEELAAPLPQEITAEDLRRRCSLTRALFNSEGGIREDA